MASRSSDGAGSYYRRAASYRRRVSFARQPRLNGGSVNSRNSSLQRSLPPARPEAPTPVTLQQRYLYDRVQSSPDLSPAFLRLANHQQTPPSPTGMRVRSRKEGAGPNLPQKARRNSGNWDDKTRQVSAELSKFCDELFRPDISSEEILSSERTEDLRSKDLHSRRSEPALQDRADEDGGFVNRRSRGSTGSIDIAEYENRPLPPPPPVMEPTPSHTYTQLAKQREKLLHRAKLLKPGQLDDVIRHIDRLMELNSPDGSVRVSSAPAPDLSGLIKENMDAWSPKGRRNITAPSQLKTGYDKTRWDPERLTIRMVDNPEPAPLIIRKRSSEPTLNLTEALDRAFDDRRGTLAGAGRSGAAKEKTQRTISFDPFSSGLEPIAEDETIERSEPQTPRSGSGSGRIKNWFRRSLSSEQGWESDNGPTPPRKDSPWKRRSILKNRAENKQAKEDKKSEEEFPMREEQAGKAKRPNKFLRFFGVKDPNPGPKAILSVLSEFPSSSETSSWQF